MWLFTDVYMAVLCLIQWQNLTKSVMGCCDVVLSYLSVFNFFGSYLCGCFMSISVAVFCLIQWQNLSKSVMGCFDVVLSYLSVFNGNGSCLCGCFMSISVAVLSLYFFFPFSFCLAD